MQGYTKLFVVTGLSPHTRDKEVNIRTSFYTSGIIPAYAGQINFHSCTLYFPGDHPRIRGRNLIIPLIALITPGSPPHTRDKWQQKTIAWTLTRITPAYAGQIHFWKASSALLWDHPRIRGTNSNNSIINYASSVSPPHTRDKLYRGVSQYR